MTTILKFDNNINFIVYLEPFENKKFKFPRSTVELSSNMPVAKSGNLKSAFVGCYFNKQLLI